MCLIALATGVSDRYKLVIAANRDEFFDRPAAPAHRWDGTDLYGGRDLKANGTWLGITESGRIAAITNYLDLINRKEFTTSRGSLVTDFLLGEYSPSGYLEKISSTAGEYDGYNLIWGIADELYYFSNKEGDGFRVSEGIHILSNHLLNTPWFKSLKFREGFKNILMSEENPKEKLFELLSDTEKSPDNMLPSTGLPPEIEKEISSIFIKMNNYGTRCSTVITIDRNNRAEFTEITYHPVRLINSFSFNILTK